jgi:hypothetical protein
MMAYKHTNSKGVTYHLNSKEVTLFGGRQSSIYFFSKDERPETATELPGDREVGENPRTGMLFVRKRK